MNRIPHALSVLSLSLAAGLPAAAQCSYNVQHVPDFDMSRQEVPPSIAGLPNSGALHGLPTSAMNWFAYFANRGITQPDGLDGPRNWQAEANYNRVTNQIDLLGQLMDTHPPYGTTGAGAAFGATHYSMAMAQNKIGVNLYWAGQGDLISPAAMRLLHELGGLVTLGFGQYVLDAPSHYTRLSGGYLTLVGQIDSCQPLSSVIRCRYSRNPGSESWSQQSPFATAQSAVTGSTAFFRFAEGIPYVEDMRWRISSIMGQPAFLDSMMCFFPRVALTPSALFVNVLNVHHAAVVEGGTQQPTQAITLPQGLGAIRSLAMHPARMTYHVITAPIGGQSHLYEIDPVTLTPVRTMSGADLRFMEVNRFGQMYLCDGSVLKLLDVRTSPPTLINQVPLGSIPRCIAYDDSTDTLALITAPGATASQLVRYDRGLTAIQWAAPLPGGVNPAGNQSLAFGPTGGIFLCGDGTPQVFRMAQSGQALAQLPGIALPAGDAPAGLNVDDAEHVLFASGGVIREYELDPNNRYISSPSPAFAGFGAGGRLCIPRSRTNHIPSMHEGPTFAEPVEPLDLVGIPDCAANCDFSTTAPTLNVLDFACFLNQFASGRIEANCDGSTLVPVLNVLDFACFLNAFAAGCS